MLVINLVGLFTFFIFTLSFNYCPASLFGNISKLILNHYIYFMPTLIVLCLILKQKPLSLSNVLFTLSSYFCIWYTIQTFINHTSIQDKLVKLIYICANSIEASFNYYLVNYAVFMSSDSGSDSLSKSSSSSNSGGSPNPDGADVTINDDRSDDEDGEDYHNPATLLIDTNGVTIDFEAIQKNKNKEFLDKKVAIQTLTLLGFNNKDGTYSWPKLPKNATLAERTSQTLKFSPHGVLKQNYTNYNGVFAIPTGEMNKLMGSIDSKVSSSNGKLGSISNITLDTDLLDPTLDKQIKTINGKKGSKDESETASLWNMIMPKIFRSEYGYIYGPENKSGKGRIDALTKWSNPNSIHRGWLALAHIEYKAPLGAPIWFLIGQNKNYADHSKYTEGSFAICIKGTLIAFFVFSTDFHSASGNFPNKGPNFDGMLGLYVNNKGIRVLPQYDTYYPQALFYDIKDKANKISITAILGYMSTLSTSNTVEYVDNKIKFRTGGRNSANSSYLLGKINDAKQENIMIDAKGDFY